MIIVCKCCFLVVVRYVIDKYDFILFRSALCAVHIICVTFLTCAFL